MRPSADSRTGRSVFFGSRRSQTWRKFKTNSNVDGDSPTLSLNISQYCIDTFTLVPGNDFSMRLFFIRTFWTVRGIIPEVLVLFNLLMMRLVVVDTFVCLCALHRMRLAAGGDTIRQHGGVEALERSRDRHLQLVVVQLLLRRIFIIAPIEPAHHGHGYGDGGSGDGPELVEELIDGDTTEGVAEFLGELELLLSGRRRLNAHTALLHLMGEERAQPHYHPHRDRALRGLLRHPLGQHLHSAPGWGGDHNAYGTIDSAERAPHCVGGRRSHSQPLSGEDVTGRDVTWRSDGVTGVRRGSGAVPTDWRHVEASSIPFGTRATQSSGQLEQK